MYNLWCVHIFVQYVLCIHKIHTAAECNVVKVIIHKSRGKISLVEQDTIENVSAAYLKLIINFLRKNFNFFFTFILCNFLVRTLQYLKKKFAYENMKKMPSNVAHNRPPFFFQYCQPAQNQPKSQFLFHKFCSPREFCITTLNVVNAVVLSTTE